MKTVSVKQIEGLENDQTLVVDLPGKYKASVWKTDSSPLYIFLLVLRSPQAQMRRMSYTEMGRAKTADEAIAILARWHDNLKVKLDEKAERRTKRNDARKESTKAAIEKVQVGDIFSTSWGYDQTNVEFFKVVEVGERSIKVVQVAQKIISGDGWGGRVIPCPENIFDAKVYTRIPELGYKGQVHFNSPIHGTAYEWDGNPKYFSDGH